MAASRRNVSSKKKCGWRSLAVRLLAALIASGSAAGARAAEPSSFRIAEQAPCVCNLVFYVALDLDLFGQHGLRAELVKEPTPLTALLTGGAEMTIAAPTVAMLARVQGKDVRVLVTSQDRITQAIFVRDDFKVPAGSDWRTVANGLRGLKLGITVRGGSTDTNIRYLLTEAGLKPDEDVTILPLGLGPSVIAAMQSKQVDAVVSYQPLTQMMLGKKLGRMAIDFAAGQGPDALNQPFIVGIVENSYAAQHADVLERVVASTKQAIEFVRNPTNAETVQRIAGKYLQGMDDAALRALVDQAIPLLDPAYTKEDHEHVLTVLKKMDLLKHDVAYVDFITGQTPR
jgi:NitT/TauT family transport system substrate-binding protein